MTLTPVIWILSNGISIGLARWRYFELGGAPELDRDSKKEAAKVALNREELRPCVASLLSLDLHLRKDLLVLTDDERVVDVAMRMQTSKDQQSLFVPVLHCKVARTLRKEPCARVRGETVRTVDE